MLRLYVTLSNFLKSEDGAAMVEYAVLIGLITVAAVALIGGAGGWIANQWSQLQSAVVATPTPWAPAAGG